MRLIDADAAIDAIVNCTNCGTEDVLRAYVVKHSLENGWTGGIVDALDAIEQLPSAEPEAISRWKKEFREYVDSLDIARDDWKGIIEYIDELPSIQPDVIRCKDCKWYGRADKRRFYRGMDCLQKRIDTIVPDRDFCSRAERKKNGL